MFRGIVAVVKVAFLPVCMPSWMTKEVGCAIRQKRRMWMCYRTSVFCF